MKSCSVKSFFAAAFASLCVCAASAAATVTLGTVQSHDPWDGQFDVSYTLSGVDAGTDYKVAFDVTAAGRTAGVTNAAARLADGNFRQTLDTLGLFGAVTTDAKAKVRVSLIAVKSGTYVADATGEAVGALGDVMIIDVSGGSAAEGYPVSYISDVDLGTLNCDVYKTTKIALLKVAAGTAYPVDPTNATATAVNTITPVKDYFIGIFPVTEAQYAQVMGGDAASTAPKTAVAWSTLRGGVATSTAITSTSDEGFFQKMCAKCRDSRGAIGGFDLPTEVQWEIAARAGSAAPFGSYLKDGETVVGSAETVEEFAVYGETEAQGVGSKLPNAWGLFDTAGNVWEWCRDDYTAAGTWTVAETPKVNDGGQGKVIRGGCYDSAAEAARLTNRNNHSPSAFNSDSKTGFRLSMTCN